MGRQPTWHQRTSLSVSRSVRDSVRSAANDRLAASLRTITLVNDGGRMGIELCI